MKNLLFFLLVWLGIVAAAVAQRPIHIDSLRRVLARLDQQAPSFTNDTARVNTLLEVVSYHFMHTDSGFYFLNKTLKLAQKINWPKGIGMAYLYMAYVYQRKNDLDKSIVYAQKTLDISLKNNELSLMADGYLHFAGLYEAKKNYPLALKYMGKAYAINLKQQDYYRASMALNNTGSVYGESGNRQKAFDYYQRSLTMAREHRQPLVEAMSLANLGNILKDSAGHEAEGTRMIEQANKLFKQLNRPVFLADGLETIGHVYLNKKQYAKALPYIQEALDTYHTYNWPQELDEGHNFDKGLYRIHKGLNHPAKALFHLEQYTALLDSTLRSEIKSGRDVVQMQLDKQTQQVQIDQLRIRELEQQKSIQNRNQLALLVGVSMLLLLIGSIVLYNRKLKIQNKDLLSKNNMIKEFGQKIQAVEIAALRAQMNPHFIFNCLNSIQYFTAQNDADTASDYLTKFSRLIRLVLENSRSERVTLANELETLRLYIEMEAMRFGQKVRYSIIVEPTVDVESIQIPPLLIQPFVENAIWHGLMHKPDGGSVTVAVQQPQDHLLEVSITDDGVGRIKAAAYKSKSATSHKSFGMKVTAERIDLINQMYHTHTQVRIDDLTDAAGQPIGTKVMVEIPI